LPRSADGGIRCHTWLLRECHQGSDQLHDAVLYELRGCPQHRYTLLHGVRCRARDRRAPGANARNADAGNTNARDTCRSDPRSGGCRQAQAHVAILAARGRTDTYTTGAGIMTSSSFETVVGWYRQNLPPGWHNMTIGDMQQLSKQLSSTSIMQMLGAQPPPSDPAAASAAAAPSADPIRISLFSPPAGSKAKTGVMILQHGNSPVEALLQAKVAPAP
jgi:hypothetical protein